MKSTTWVRWTLATAVFLAIGWAMRQYGLNTARLLLLLLLVLVYVYGGHGRPTKGAGDAAGPGDPTGHDETAGVLPPDDRHPDGS